MNTLTAPVPPTDQQFKRQRIGATIAAFGLMMTTATGVAMGFTVVPGMEHFSVGAGQYLLWASIWTLTVAVMFSQTARLMNRYGSKVVSLVGTTGLAAGYLGMGFSPNIYVFYAFSVLLGIAWTGSTVLVSTHLTTVWHTHARRGSVVGLVATGTGVGGFIWGFLAPQVGAAAGFTGLFVALAAYVAVVGILPAIFLVREPKAQDHNTRDLGQTDAGEDKKRLLKGYAVPTILIGLAYFLFSFEAIFAALQPAVFASFAIDPTTAGILVSVFSVSGVVANPVLGYVYDKLGVRALYATLVALFILGLPLIALLGSSGSGVLFFLLPIAALSLGVPGVILPLITIRAVGQARFPLVFGIALSLCSVGLAIAAPGWGFTFDVTGGYVLALYAGGALGLLGVALLYIGYRSGSARLKGELSEPQLDVVNS